MARIPPGVTFEIIDLNRRYTKAEMERLSEYPDPRYEGLRFIAVRRIEEAEVCYIIDPSNFGCSSDMKHRDTENERGE